MKLNATTERIPLLLPEFSTLHPFVPLDQAQGYQELLEELERDLCEITGYDKISFQPNSGAQGEYAGLCAIRSYLESIGETQRKVRPAPHHSLLFLLDAPPPCPSPQVALIPKNAHGTNPASAAMAGLTVVDLDTDRDGRVGLGAWQKAIEQHRDDLACIMVTYPSTNGIFEDTIK